MNMKLWLLLFSLALCSQVTLHTQESNFVQTESPSEVFVNHKNTCLSYGIPTYLEMLTLDLKIHNTIWTATDVENNIDLYVFFQNNTKGIAVVPRGYDVTLPADTLPIKYIQAGKNPDSGIFMVTSQTQMLYYSFQLLSSRYLAISAGYQTIDPLLNIALFEYFDRGYILQLVPQ